MGHTTLGEKCAFFALALLAFGIMWNVSEKDETAKLATIVFPVENVRYAVDYGQKAVGVHAREISLLDGGAASISFFRDTGGSLTK